MSFKAWLRLQEIATSTSGTGSGDIAMFKRPVFGEPFRRANLASWGEEDHFFKKKKLKEHDYAQSFPSAPLKAQSSMAQTSGNQPALLMPVKLSKKSKK